MNFALQVGKDIQKIHAISNQNINIVEKHNLFFYANITTFCHEF